MMLGIKVFYPNLMPNEKFRFELVRSKLFPQFCNLYIIFRKNLKNVEKWPDKNKYEK